MISLIKPKRMPKSRLDVKHNNSTPFIKDGFEQYTAIVTKNNEGKIIDTKILQKTKAEKERPAHAGGPVIRTLQDIRMASMENENVTYDENIIQNWTPHMSLSVFDDQTMRPLSAAEALQKRDQRNFIPQFFNNPMQDLDYIVIEALCRFTFMGPLMSALTKFIVGTGFKPELELINKHKDDDKNLKEIEGNQEIIDMLIGIDNQIDRDDENFGDVSFVDKITALIDVGNTFNRSALVFGYDTPIEVFGKKIKNIPSSLKFQHARDLGIIKVDPDTWRLEAVQTRNAFNMIPKKDMIYYWNPIVSAKARNVWFYGDSMAMPFIDAARVIRKNIGVNFPAMGEATWSGMPVIVVRPQGESKSDKETEYTEVVNRFVRGGPNVMLENPEDVALHNIEFNPKVKEFQDLTEALLRYCVAATGLPQSMFYDESQSNRSTMLGKIQLATATVINPLRNIIDRMITPQWHQRWFRQIYAEKNPDLLKKFRIRLAFNDINVAEWFDKVEAANQVRGPLTDASYGELIGLDNYTSKLDSTGKMPMGGQGTSFKFGGETGNEFELKKRNKEF